MLYQNKPIRWFADFAEPEEGALATRYVYRNDEGTEYIHTVRNRTGNGDGSYLISVCRLILFYAQLRAKAVQP